MLLQHEKMLTPEDQELERKTAVLDRLEAQLADRELELASTLADLIHFERHYLQTVGRRYAILDGLKAKIAEAYARQNPDNPNERDQARQARAQAQESARAVGADEPETVLPNNAASTSQTTHSESLRNLYRQAAKLLHPDLTLDAQEKEIRHRMMAEVNDAYKRGDEGRIRAILREWRSSPENVHGDGPGAELVRVIRKIAQVEKRLKIIATEMDQLCQGELFKLRRSVEEAHQDGRDLMMDLSDQLDGEIAQARDELKLAPQTAAP